MIQKGLSLAVCLSMLTPPAAFARNRKGDGLLKDGQKAEAAMDWDRALELYEQALQEDPADGQYQLRARRVRFQAAQQHVDRGMKLRGDGKLEEASAEFQRAYAIDPASGIAQDELKRTLRMIEEARGAPATGADRGLTSTDKAEKESAERISNIEGVPVLKPLTRNIPMLRMNNQPVRVLFETLGKLAGINVVIDPEYQQTGRNYSIDLVNTTLEQGLDNLAVLTKSYWKPITENSIFITNDNPTKRRDYEELVVKAFYIKNITTPQELQEIATVIRSVTDIRRVFTVNHLSAFIVRGTVDQVVLAEKLVADLDKPKSEVVVDVYVMEVSRVRTRDLAASLVSGGLNGLSLPISSAPRAVLGTGSTSTTTATATGTNVTLNNLGRLSTGDFALTLPGATLKALMTDRGTRVLQTPQVRATDSVKSSLKIGDRYPYATGSFQPGVGAVGGVSPLVSTQFQFADVGVNVDITPKIHSADEVSLQVEMDLSNIRDRIDVGGLSQPVIGQRKITHNVRLRQGEISVIGGLIQDQDTSTTSGLPGLGNLPVLGRLFSGSSTEKSQSELLVALVPHIIRSTDITELNQRSVAAGPDQTVKLRMAPLPEVEATPPDPEAAKAEAPKVEAPKPPAVTQPPPTPAAPAVPAPPGVALRLVPSAPEARVGQNFTVTVQVDNATDLFGAPMHIQFDNRTLRLNDISVGSLMSGDGQMPIFSRNILNDRGEAAVILNRLPGSPGISGSGVLLNLSFQAVAAGASTLRLNDSTLRNSRMEPISAAVPSVNLTVR
jgi:general secretion pathway protein D